MPEQPVSYGTDVSGAARPADRGGRKPGELFDELRLRLERLAANHPSAVRERSSDGQVPPASVAPDEAGPADAAADAGPGDAMLAGGDIDSAEPVSAADDTGPTGPDRGEGAAGLAGDPGWSAGSRGDEGWQSAGRRHAPGEAYRPWFMSGEPGAGAPWFADELDPG